MIDVTVIRGDGRSVGEIISDPLIETEAVAFERGRNEIDGESLMRPVTLETVFRPDLQTGRTIEVLDSLQGLVWRGKVTSVDIAVEGVTTTATLRVEKYVNN